MSTTVVKNPDLKAPFSLDAVLLSSTLLLVGFGLLMLYSTTGSVSHERFGDSYFFVRRQGIAAILGVFAMLVCTWLRPNLLRRLSPYLIFVSVLLLLLPLIPGISGHAGGASRWVNLFGFRFQPGEFVKLFFVIFLAGYLSRREGTLHTFRQGVLIPGLLVGLVAGLFLLQPDFGSTALMVCITIAMIMSAGARLRYVIYGGIASAFALGALVVFSPYRMRRIFSFLSPEQDPTGSGYQLMQSLIAVGSGQFSGVGLGASQQKLFFLPAAHTDFIFSVIAEELGFIGSLALIVFFLVFFWRGMQIARSWADDTFVFSLTVGLTLLIALPAFLNIGVSIGMLPTKGMVLPLVSYGGTSLVACLMTVGLLLSCARYLRIKKSL